MRAGQTVTYVLGNGEPRPAVIVRDLGNLRLDLTIEVLDNESQPIEGQKETLANVAYQAVPTPGTWHRVD